MELADRAKTKILLLANYEPDGQASMLAFSKLMATELEARSFEVRTIRPAATLGKFRLLGKSLAKWLAYVDKYLLFLPHLLKEKQWADIVHICDHSNAVYVPFVNDIPHIVTCHDLLAVRAGLGEDTCCPLTPLGRLLQLWILHGLRRASMIACDSTATKIDAERLLGYVGGRQIYLVPLAMHVSFKKLPSDEANIRLSKVAGLLSEIPYLLHVGSSQPRKNRESVMKVFASIKDKFKGQCVFAGSSLTNDQNSLAKELGIFDRVVQVTSCDADTLEALYSQAHAFIFPSYSEGFGWPIIEAQAAGCPVVSSNIEPCPETAGDGAIFCEPGDIKSLALAICELQDQNRRNELQQLGYRNIERFVPKQMTERYLELYERLMKQKGLGL
ncbi:MAG: glycosyltransferase family 4 protein [Candidatus Obscuribacterales bacterium]|nr:glycosyltransferase family 4 protein [Candidatus Obscuribacterales bacterium]